MESPPVSPAPPASFLQVPVDLQEQDLLATALDRGFLTAPEIEEARKLRLRDGRRDVYRPLSEYLIDIAALTRAQVARLQDELAHPDRLDELPGYKIVGELGRGSMGTVYRARQLNLHRDVAVKVLARRLSRNYQYLHSFLREARLAALTLSAYWPRVYDRGEARGQQFFVMELVDGHSTEQLLAGRKRLQFDQVLHIGSEVCAALAHLHSLGIIHRDVKPDNIVVGRDGQLKMIDLGLSRPVSDEALISSERGAAIGTPFYMSPEQTTGSRDVDIRSDLYSLGATLFHLITGRPVFEEQRTSILFEAHLNAVPPTPSSLVPGLPTAFDQLVLNLLEKSPAKRPNSAWQIREQLQAMLRTTAEPELNLYARLELDRTVVVESIAPVTEVVLPAGEPIVGSSISKSPSPISGEGTGTAGG